jgi:hypothetical protein
VSPSLCHSFARATRSIRLVTAAYYADIICTAARPIVYDLDALQSSTQAKGGGGAAAFDAMVVQQRLGLSPAFNSVYVSLSTCVYHVGANALFF